MKRIMYKRIMGGLALLVVGFVGGAYAKEAAQKEIVQKTVADLEWKAMAPGVPVMTAEGWTGPGGSHCSWRKFPKGFVSPVHFHTKDVQSVVIAGNWGSWVEGAPEKLVGLTWVRRDPRLVDTRTSVTSGWGDPRNWMCVPLGFTG